MLCGLDALVKQGDEHGLEAVEVGAVVNALLVQLQVNQEQGITTRPANQGLQINSLYTYW